MIALITAALQGLAAIPKLIEMLMQLQIESRIQALEKNQQTMREGFTALSSASTPKEIQDAAHAVSSAWNKP